MDDVRQFLWAIVRIVIKVRITVEVRSGLGHENTS